MLKKFALISSSLIMLVFSACKKELADSGNAGIYVELNSHLYYANVNTAVFTIPESKTIYMNSSDKAVIDSLNSGVYEVFAIIDSWGSGSEIVTLEPGERKNLDIDIDLGVFPDFISLVQVIEPEGVEDNYFFEPDEPISFIIKVLNANLGDTIFWKSDLDGDIGLSVVREDLTSHFETSIMPTQGIHKVSIQITGDKNSAIRKVISVINMVPPPVFQYPIQTNGLNHKLSWSTYQGSNFARYLIFERRLFSGSQGYSDHLIKSVEEQYDTTSFIPINNEFNCEYYISVSVHCDNEQFTYLHSRYSNKQYFGRNFFGPIFRSDVKSMYLHEFKDWAYLFYNDEIILYDYREKQLLKNRPIDLYSYFYDVHYSGDDPILYVINDFRVFILDGTGLELIRSVNFERNVNSVVAVSEDIIVVSLLLNESESAIYSYSLEQSAIVDSLLFRSEYSYYLQRNTVSDQIIVSKLENKMPSEDEFYLLDYELNGELNGFLNGQLATANNIKADPYVFSPNGKYFVSHTYPKIVFGIDNNEISVVGDFLFDNNDVRIVFNSDSDTIYRFDKYGSIEMYTCPELRYINTYDSDFRCELISHKYGSFYGLCLISGKTHLIKIEPSTIIDKN